jgi:flagellar biosynthesis regulator FlaF
MSQNPSAAPHPAAAMRAYGAALSARSQREQEAEIFTILAGRLRAALRAPEGLAPVRAVADARRVFTAVEALVIHASNPLPQELRAAIATVAGRALQEVGADEPDLDFLASIAEDLAAGLAASPRSAS